MITTIFSKSRPINYIIIFFILVFAFLIAAIVSPPPTIEINCLDFVLFDIINANDLVPFENFLFS